MIGRAEVEEGDLPVRQLGVDILRPNHDYSLNDLLLFHSRPFTVFGPSMPNGLKIYGTDELKYFIHKARDLYQEWGRSHYRSPIVSSVDAACSCLGHAIFDEPVNDMWLFHSIVSQAEARGVDFTGLPLSSQIILGHQWKNRLYLWI